ncbi:hypothetical protein [Mycobacteroides abscessus]|uniref:hypothetical protein n=1 Tax=Mycobacteroides abscessus TaxID=36809 RepID=UPI000929D3AF|nr:hypothetical protein [Mycobacteroides abscessus]SIL61305.1 Uncharacterised protein [Mycobacteroides abscessus subsp. abscessus]
MSPHIKDGMWVYDGDSVCNEDVSPWEVRKLIDEVDGEMAGLELKREALYAVLLKIEKV